MTEIVAPKSCPYGHTREDLGIILGPRLQEFMLWMRGQTVMSCEGRQYNHDTGEWSPNACAETPHGLIVYGSDLRQFLNGGGPLD
mgnify:CR=1 FL=1